jgi:hypothetical protein
VPIALPAALVEPESPSVAAGSPMLWLPSLGDADATQAGEAGTVGTDEDPVPMPTIFLPDATRAPEWRYLAVIVHEQQLV